MNQPNQQTFKLERIHKNPFQPRRTPRSARKMIDLCVSVANIGMKQTPQGRPFNGDEVQLSFGMGRLQAHVIINQVQYRLSNDQTPLPGEFGLIDLTDEDQEQWQTLVAICSARLDQDVRFSEMPVNVCQMSDREMFESAVSENEDRDGLTDIDRAQAIKTHRETFGATMDETAKLFHMARSTAANLVRMLDLPEKVQDRIGSGEISRGQVNKLLTVQRIAPQCLESIASKVEAGQPTTQVDLIIATELGKSKNVVLMHEGYKRPPALGGDGLWPLETYTPARFNHAKAADVLRVYPGYKDVLQDIDPDKKPAQYLQEMIDWCVDFWGDETIEGSERTPEYVAELWRVDTDFASLIMSLVNPLPCGCCHLHAVINGAHYCTNKLCHNWKLENWPHDQMIDFCQESGIAIHQESDGEFSACTKDNFPLFGLKSNGKYGDIVDPFVAWIENKNQDLRLVPCEKTSSNNRHTGSLFFQVAITGQTLVEYRQEQSQAEIDEAATALLRESDQPRLTAKEAEEAEPAPVWAFANVFLWKHIDLFAGNFMAMDDVIAMLIAGSMSAEQDYDAIYNLLTGEPYDVDFNNAAEIKKMLAHRAIINWCMSNQVFDVSDDLGCVVQNLIDDFLSSIGVTLPKDWQEMVRAFEQDNLIF